MMHYGPGMYEVGGLGILGGILHLLFLVLIVCFVFGLMRRSGGYREDHWHGRGRMDRGDSAVEILKARYAKGDLTKEQFDQMKKDLES